MNNKNEIGDKMLCGCVIASPANLHAFSGTVNTCNVLLFTHIIYG